MSYFPKKVLNFARIVFMVDFFPGKVRKFRRWVVWSIGRRRNKCKNRAKSRKRGRIKNS